MILLHVQNGSLCSAWMGSEVHHESDANFTIEGHQISSQGMADGLMASHRCLS